MHKQTSLKSAALLGMSLLLAHGAASAANLAFSSATASFEQTVAGSWTAAKAIDGIVPAVGDLAGGAGWAIFNNGVTGSETALFTLSAPLSAGSYVLTYTLSQNYGDSHVLDTFSLGYTTAATPTLASTQAMVSITSASATNGLSLATPSMGNLDATGTLTGNLTSVYTITAQINSAAPITGLTLNAIDNPTSDPGLQANGNFVLSEFTVAATPVPEPSEWAMFAAGLAVIGQVVRHRRRNVR